MNQSRLRRIARLERLAQPYLKRKKQADRQWQLIRSGAADHAAVLAFLIRYGKPRIDEPLSRAYQRCSESDAWKECCDQFSSLLLDERKQRAFEPYDRNKVNIIGAPLRHIVISSFSGVNEKQKLENAFTSAPPWIIWFTFADYTAELLGLRLPDLSKVSRFQRSKANFDLWWGLPTAAFERESWPHGREHEPLAHTDLNLFRPKMEYHDIQMTPRERKRALAIYSASDLSASSEACPSLTSIESINLSFEETSSLIQHSGRDFHHSHFGRIYRLIAAQRL
jgi:hypothetical protein